MSTLADEVKPSSWRLFFALWPEEEVLGKLVALRQKLALDAGKPVEPEKFHITLLFLGQTPADKVEAVRTLANEFPWPSCELVLDRMEHWLRPAVLCLTATEVPQPLAESVKTLRRKLSRLGFKLERRPFRPHLTLARKVRKRIARCDIEPIRWPVRGVALVASELNPEGSRYRVLESWNARV